MDYHDCAAGEIADAFSQYDQSDREFNQALDSLNSYMLKNKFQPFVQTRFREYFTGTCRVWSEVMPENALLTTPDTRLQHASIYFRPNITTGL